MNTARITQKGGSKISASVKNVCDSRHVGRWYSINVVKTEGGAIFFAGNVRSFKEY